MQLAKPVLIALAIISASAPLQSAELELLKAPPDNPRELGRVHWIRGYEKAASVARHEGKPILLLFQEVPGCSTCVGYGQRVLSHPLVVEAAETIFVPAVVYNNVGGEDAKTLKKFGEPSWNNPVVRILGSDGEALVPRLASDYALAGLTGRMVQALEKSGAKVPGYLRLLREETEAMSGNLEEATFAMYCFWTGEKVFGSIPGVIRTKPGFTDGSEVVRVWYNPANVDYKTLLSKAREQQCASRVFVHSQSQRAVAETVVGPRSVAPAKKVRPDSEPKYYLAHTLMRFVPMTPLQTVKVNAAIGSRQNPFPYLSPRQRTLFQFVEDHPDLAWQSTIGSVSFADDWERAGTLFRKHR